MCEEFQALTWNHAEIMLQDFKVGSGSIMPCF